MELFYIAFVLLILFCVVSGWLLYHQMVVRSPEFKKGNFFPLEQLLLKEVFGLFDDALSRKLRLQLKYFKTRGKYWRIEQKLCHRVELYEEEDDLMEEVLMFPLRSLSDLARIQFKINGCEHAMVLRSYNGCILGWEIKPNPGRKLRRSRLEVLSTEILQHPELHSKSTAQTGSQPKPVMGTFLKALLESPSLKEVRSPKNLNRLENRLRSTGTKLPEAFLSFLGYADGMVFENGKIYGSRALLKIMSREKVFWPLAEFREELLGVRPGDSLGRVYVMHKKIRKLKPVKGDFSEQLLNHLDTFEIRA